MFRSDTVTNVSSDLSHVSDSPAKFTHIDFAFDSCSDSEVEGLVFVVVGTVPSDHIDSTLVVAGDIKSVLILKIFEPIQASLFGTEFASSDKPSLRRSFFYSFL